MKGGGSDKETLYRERALEKARTDPVPERDINHPWAYDMGVRYGLIRDNIEHTMGEAIEPFKALLEGGKSTLGLR